MSYKAKIFLVNWTPRGFKSCKISHTCHFAFNSDKRNSDIEDDYTCAFSKLLKSTIFCVFCKQLHPSYKSRKVTDTSQRKSILRKNGRCFLCLEKGHLMKNCSINYQCNKCILRYAKVLEIWSKYKERFQSSAYYTRQWNADNIN